MFDQLRDDVVQDVAIRLFVEWKSYDPGRPLLGLIYTYALNRCIDELRKRVVRGDHLSRPDDERMELRDEASDGSSLEQLLCVQQVLAALEMEPAKRRGGLRPVDILSWIVEHSPTTEEFAHFLKTSLGAAKTFKSAFLIRMRALCKQYCGHEECLMRPTR